jgi:tetratricopeptide (TPR) repeat protein
MYSANNTRIQLAIGLNSEAVAMIENGNFESAIPKLTEVLKQASTAGALQGFKKSRIQCCSEERVSMGRDPTSLDECMASSSQQSQAEEEPDQQQEEQGEEAHQQQDYVFRRCIQIPISTETTIYFESPLFIYVVIIFNLALAHQLSAMECSDGSESASLRLSKAAQLYELAFNLQRDECMEDNALFSMATINNLALVYKSLNDSENAEKCFQYLLSILMLFVGCGEQTSEFVEYFFRNTASHLVVFKDRTAAAAA